MDEQTYLDHLQELWQKNWPDHLRKDPEYPFGEILITEYLQRWAALRPDKPCLIYYGREITFKELDDFSNRFAAFLSSKGLRKGDRVAVFLPTCPQFHIVFYGILKRGCAHVPVNPMFKKHELLYELQDSEAELIVTLDQLVPLVEEVRNETKVREIVVTRYADFLPEHPSIPPHPSLLALSPVECPGTTDLLAVFQKQYPHYPHPAVNPDDLASLNYTGGTTGMPKGCEHSQRDMIYTMATMTTYNRSMDSDFHPVGLIYLPSFWIAGQLGLLLPVFTGETYVLLSRWDPLAVLTAIEKYKVTSFSGVLDNLVELMEHPDLPLFDLSSLRTTTTSSFIKKLNVDYRQKWQALTGLILRESAYGMTETHTCDTFTTALHQDDRDLKTIPTFCGLPVPGTLLKILDFETRKLVPMGSEGEIFIKTPSLLKSYWKKPEATKTLLRDGWLATGDIGMLDEDGFLHFLGRRKEMLKVRGMSVFPSEIEIILGHHPAIHQCTVVGKPDPAKGEVPVAFIKLKPGSRSLPAETLHQWCRENMATYKVPQIRFIDEFPLTTTGKVKKEELKKMNFALDSMSRS